MVRLGISVEGQTEERFVKDLLGPHLLTLDIHATPVIVATSRSASGKKAKGGGINVDRIRGEIFRLLQGYPDGYVTSLYDFYGFDGRQPKEDVKQLEARIANSVNNPANFIPYVQLHEFEGLLLSEPAAVAEYFQTPQLDPIISAVIAKVGSPEQVNDGPQTAPSKRLEAWTLQYSPSIMRYSKQTKTRHGPLLAAHLTLPVIRQACLRFDEWLSTLEQLS